MYNQRSYAFQPRQFACRMKCTCCNTKWPGLLPYPTNKSSTFAPCDVCKAMTRFTLSRWDLIRARFTMLIERISQPHERQRRRAAVIHKIYVRIKSEGRMR